MSSFWIDGLDQTELILQDSLIFGVCCLSGHCDKHVVDAVSIAEVWIMGIFKIFPRISRILHQMTKAGGRQNHRDKYGCQLGKSDGAGG